MRRVAVYAVVGCAAVAAVVLWRGAAPPRGIEVPHAGSQAGERNAIALPSPATPPAGASVPAPLAGSSAPRLPLDPGGHLAKSRAVRDFFDYCLTAQSELDAAALDALVAREIAAQLDGTVAQPEALDVWHRYRAIATRLQSCPMRAPSPTSPISARCSSRSTGARRSRTARSATGANRFSVRSSGGSATTSRGCASCRTAR